MKKVTSFSNSSIKTYEQCPYKFRLTRIDGLQEPTGDAAQRGKDIHTIFENALLQTAELPDEYSYWNEYINLLIEKGTQSEVMFAVTKDWQRSEFLAPETWLRGIYDAIYFNHNGAHVLDWKTGKERDYEDQLKLYAATIMSCYPKVERVTLEICYIDLKKSVSHGALTKDDLPTLKKWITERITKIENDDIYAPKPTYGCKWCHFRKSNGGPCQW